MARVLHSYGGMIVPRSFICLQNLKSLYDTNIEQGCMFVGEFIDRNSTSVQVPYFPHSKIMGCEKNCPLMAEYIQYMERINSTDFTEESHFTGGSGKWFYEKIQSKEVKMIGAEHLGMKDTRGKPITIEMLLNDSFIDLSHSASGVYVPEDEILKRNAYQWFPRLSTVQVLDSSTNVGKLLLVSGENN